MSDESIRQIKDSLRHQILSRRLSLTDKKYAELNTGLIKNLPELKRYLEGGVVHTYLASAAKREPDPQVFLKNENRELVTNVLGPDRHNTQLVAYNPRAETIVGNFGIPRPVNLIPAGEATNIRAFFIPMLGFDEQGTRLGYGWGFYDQLLARYPQAVKIGLAFELSKTEGTLPRENHDIPMDYIVTEAKIYQINPG